MFLIIYLKQATSSTLDPWILKTLDPCLKTYKTLDPKSMVSKDTLDEMTPCLTQLSFHYLGGCKEKVETRVSRIVQVYITQTAQNLMVVFSF